MHKVRYYSRMRHFLSKIVVTAFSLILVAEFIPGIEVDSLRAALLGALVLGIVNAVIRPILIILTLPVTILTLGLFIFVLNALLFWFVGAYLDINGLRVEGFVPAFFGSLVVSIVSAFVNTKHKDD